MRESCFEFYPREDSDYKLLWDEGILVLDTNVLLNLYRYGQKACSELLNVLQHLQGQLWIPHQIAYEFHRNRLNVIVDQNRALEGIRSCVASARAKIDEKLGSISDERSPLLDLGSFKKAVDRAFSNLEKKISAQAAAYPIYPGVDGPDFIRDSLTDIYAGRVGPALESDRLLQIQREADRRYVSQIPPGFGDARDKDAPRKYGDYILWKQMLDHAKEKKKPVVFVTEDTTKGDWWLSAGGKTIGPRPELRREMREVAGVDFHMYQTRAFAEYAAEHLRLKLAAATVKEVGRVRSRVASGDLSHVIDFKQLMESTALMEALRATTSENMRLIAESMQPLAAQYADIARAFEPSASMLKSLDLNVTSESFRKSLLDSLSGIYGVRRVGTERLPRVADEAEGAEANSAGEHQADDLEDEDSTTPEGA